MITAVVIVLIFVLVLAGMTSPLWLEHFDHEHRMLRRRNRGEQILRDLRALHDLDPDIVFLPKEYDRRIANWLEPYRNDSYRSLLYEGKRGSYRELAKLLNDLAHPRDLDGEIPLLPPSIAHRTDAWLRQHRRLIEGRRPKALSR